MAVTHKRGTSYTTDAGTVATTNETFTGDSEINVDFVVADNTTDGVCAVPSVDVSQIMSTMLYSDKSITVKTYAATVLVDTIAVTGGKQINWASTDTGDCPFTADFDELKITNTADEAAAKVKLRVLLNMTALG
jgi:hypothetical protein